MKHFAAILLLACGAACVQPLDAPVVIFVGASLPGIEHSVVIVDRGIIQAVGTQVEVPIPTGSRKINGLGKTLVPLDPARPIKQGDEAAFALYEGDPGQPGAKLIGRMQGARWEPAQ